MIFTASSDPSNWRSADIQMVTLEDRRVRTLFEGTGSDGRYIESGHVVYLNAGRLFAAPFDVARLEVRGPSVSIVEGIAASGTTGIGQVDISPAGYLLYQRGPVAGSTVLHWMDRAGRTEPIFSDAQDYQFPSLSPDDASRLLFALNGGIWVLDKGRRNRVDSGGPSSANAPVWVPPDGNFIVFRGQGGLFWTRADGARPPQPLLESDSFLNALAITPDGRTLAYSENTPKGVAILMTRLERTSDGLRADRGQPFLESPSSNTLGAFSRDGRLFAFASGRTNAYNVYVRAFPDAGWEALVSTTGGHMPVWSQTKDELFYRTLNGQVMVVPYAMKGDTFVAEAAVPWSAQPLAYSGLNRNFDLHPDGRRLVVAVPAEGRELADHALLVLNFFDEVRRRAGN